VRKQFFRREIVRKKVAALFPSVSDFRPILSGEDSQTFRFDSEDGKFIFRVNPSAEVFRKDRFVYERFAAPKLPIPKALLIGQLEDHFYCVSQEMPGRTLEDLDPEHISQLLVPTCEVWRAIAESDLSGISECGLFDSKGAATFSTWHDFLVGNLDAAKRQWESVHSDANVNLINEWVDTFQLLAASCPEERGLVHGDFGSNNVLAEGKQITGVVDWSEAMIGDPLYDVANIFFWRTWLPCMEQQARYFEASPPNVPDWEERILCYQLRIGLSEIFGNSLKHGDEVMIWALTRWDAASR
jgi:hygromycin-B 4-O-kinase